MWHDDTHSDNKKIIVYNIPTVYVPSPKLYLHLTIFAALFHPWDGLLTIQYKHFYRIMYENEKAREKLDSAMAMNIPP